MAKKAVLIACNYPGTEAELKGCYNDASNMQSLLVDRFGFTLDDMEVLVDTDPDFTQATGENICLALNRLIQSACPGDTLFVYFSGHGTRFPDETGDPDETGYDECIVPTDMIAISDDFFKALVCAVPDGCRITIVTDSCHSGGLIDGAKEQIGESTKGNQEEETVKDNVVEEGYQEKHKYLKSKSLPLSTLIDLLKQKTGKDDIDARKLTPKLFDVFGEDLNPKVKKFMNSMLGKLKKNVGSLAQEFMKQKLNENEESAEPELQSEIGTEQEAYAGDAQPDLPTNGILLSGCQTHQTSVDVQGEVAYGAFTNAILTVLAESDESVSNHELVTKATELLKVQGFTQSPGLYCSDEHANAAFVC